MNQPPHLQLTENTVYLSGDWLLANVAAHKTLEKQLRELGSNQQLHWQLTDIQRLDSTCALLLWQAWAEQFPAHIELKAEQQKLFQRWQNQTLPVLEKKPLRLSLLFQYWRQQLANFIKQVLSFIVMLGQLVLDGCYVLRHPLAIPWAEVSAAIYDAGVRALGITALVGFLIGIVLSYLSSLQLKLFGAEVYIIHILGLSIIRELGPLLAAILVAGRSGSAMSAQIGIMRVTEELDALSAMGISHSLRLIFPKVLALSIVLPLLSVWTCLVALFGGLFSAQTTLDINVLQLFVKLPDVVPLANVFIGLLKSATFGLFIALIACHFGFRIEPNTESLGNETTNSVVAAITIVIMLDAVYAILFRSVGMPS